MAYLTGPLLFTGRVGELRSYYNRTLKRYILSTKGGCPREIILNSPRFVRTRENMCEFTGCTRWASMLRGLLNPLSHLRRGYYFSAMTSMAKLIQKSDTGSTPGHRSIRSSRAALLLPELTFNKVHPFEQVLFLNYRLTRPADLQTLRLTVAPFWPYLALQWPSPIVSWRLVLLTALLPDLVWVDDQAGYQPAVEGCDRLTRTASTDWRPMGGETGPIELQTAVPPVTPGTLLVVALGIEINTATTPPAEPEGTMRIVECFEEGDGGQ